MAQNPRRRRLDICVSAACPGLAQKRGIYARGLCGSCYEKARRRKDPDAAHKRDKLQREKNRERVRATLQRSYYKNREKRLAGQAAWREVNGAAYNAIRRQRNSENTSKRLAKIYGITTEECERIRSRPCAICGVTDKPRIDHCHRTGRVRGRLCDLCNRGIGMLRERPDLLRRAAAYLEHGITVAGEE
jgi:hypothetical protein